MFRLITTRLLANRRGQDLVEYALIAGFVAGLAGALIPDVTEAIQLVMYKVSLYLSRAAGVRKTDITSF